MTKKTTMKSAFSVVLILCIALSLTPSIIPVSSQDEEEPVAGGTLVIRLDLDPLYLNPLIHTHYRVRRPGCQILIGLVELDTNYDPHPWLAESWEQSADGLHTTFHLVDNATWHDGTPFTSADVEYAFQQYMVYGSEGRTYFGPIYNSSATPDNYTWVLHLNKPLAPFWNFITIPSFVIIPKHLYEGTDVMTNEYNMKPVGLGPFMFKEWVKGDHITLVKNPNYFRKGYPYLDQVIYKIIPDSVTAVSALKTGDVDYVPDMDLTAVSEIEALAPTLAVKLGGYGRAYCGTIMVNLRNPILSNLKVRQAMMHAINRTSLVETVLYGNGYPIGAWFGQTAWIYNPEPLDYYPYNPTKAKELLDEAGYPPGTGGWRFTVRLLTRSGPYFGETCDMVRDFLAAVGIKTVLTIVETDTWLEWVYTDWDFELTFTTLTSTQNGDPQLQKMFLHSESIVQGIPYWNAIGYNNSEVDRLIDEQSEEVDKTKRKELWWQEQEIVGTELPIIPCFERLYAYGYATRFKPPPAEVQLATSYDTFERVWDTELAAPPSEGGIDLTTVVVVVVIVVVVAVAVVAIYLMRKR